MTVFVVKVLEGLIHSRAYFQGWALFSFGYRFERVLWGWVGEQRDVCIDSKYKSSAGASFLRNISIMYRSFRFVLCVLSGNV